MANNSFGFGAPNPYIGAQADALTQQTQRFLGQNLAGIGSNAVAVGGLGGSRQGVAQGEAIGAASTGLSSALAGMYGQAYESDANRANQYGIASMQNDTNRYGINSNANIAQGQLGLGYLNANNNYNLGLGQNQNQANSIANQYSLGLGQNQNQANSIANQYDLGQQQNANNRYGMDLTNSYQNRALDVNNGYANRALDVNMRGQDINWQNNQNQYNLGLGNQDLSAMQIGANMYGAGTNGMWGPIQNANGVYSPYTGFGTTTGTSSQGGGAMGAMGGAMGTLQLLNATGGGSGGYQYGQGTQYAAPNRSFWGM